MSIFLLYNMALYFNPRGARRSQSRYFSNGNLSMKKFTNLKNNTTFILNIFKFEGRKWSYFSYFHSLTWSNEHQKFHFRVNFAKSRFWPVRSEARAKIFTVLITWLGLVNFANLCHLGTSKGFRAVRVSWSEADHHRSRRLLDIWLWQFYEKVIEKL